MRWSGLDHSTPTFMVYFLLVSMLLRNVEVNHHEKFLLLTSSKVSDMTSIGCHPKVFIFQQISQIEEEQTSIKNINSIQVPLLHTPRKFSSKLFCPWDSAGKNTRVGCHPLLQEIFSTQRSNPGVPVASGFFTIRATREAPSNLFKHILIKKKH